MSDSCLSLSGSSACPAWSSASVSINSSQYGNFPWLKNVSTLTSFDQSLQNYVQNTYVTAKYVDLLGCVGYNSSALSDYYAQYTTSVICNGLVQSSKDSCDLSDNDSEPLCAETCALFATSEQEIMINKNLCSSTDKKYMDQIRSDFTICSNPTGSLTAGCVDGSTNEPNNCGFSSNTVGLCTYCASNAPNSTDTCCVSSNATSRCNGVSIPAATVTLQPIVTTTAAAGAGAGHHGLSGGAIAGIVIGSVAGAAILAALAVLLFLCGRRRRQSQADAGLNQPNPQRKGASPPMQQMDSPSTPPSNLNIVPGGRVARMSALREMPSSSPAYSRTSAAMFGGAKYASDSSDSEAMGASPGAMSRRIPPVTGKRHGSLSSGSALAGLESDSSPLSGATANQYSSPEGFTSGQSEQMSYFRDYYSQDDIRPGDKVAALWAYSARAGDEFELDRGEMLKVIGIWDDGWATGVRLHERAEDYDIRHREQRDSGVSNGSHRPSPSPVPSGEIKAFPLVCICLPQHWRKIIDGGVQEEDEI